MHELDDQNLFAALRGAFPVDLDAAAVETADGPGAPVRHSWRALDRATARLANLFGSLDLPDGTRVAVQTDKSVEAMLLYLAVLRAGFVYLPLNPAYQPAEVEYFIGDAEPGVVVCTGRSIAWLARLAQRAGVRHVFTLEDDGTGTLFERAAEQPETHLPVRRSADDLAAILYTSGTTGRSKGAMLTHGNLLSNARVLKDYWGWREGDVLLHALPIFHVHGLFVALHGALLNGSRMIWLQKFDAGTVARRLPDATVFMGVPTLYVRLLEVQGFGRDACRNMRLFVAGSAPLLVETFESFRRATGHTILERYGMTETLMLSSNPYHAADGERRGGTVGMALPGVGLRIVDDAGRSCPPGVIGNIEVRGPGVFRGYWRMPEKTREEFTADGWFRTGDVGRLDGDGYLAIVGRSKDLIITGGFNVYPAEIEDCLNALDGVAESAVVGVPHPDFGEGVVAVVVPKAGATLEPAAIIAAMRARVANFKVPKHCAVVDALPRNTMGKVQKKLLRETHQRLFAIMPGAPQATENEMSATPDRTHSKPGRLRELRDAGQAVWLDFVERRFLEQGGLRELIDQGATGVTSNPSIFEKAMGQGTAYDQGFRDAPRDASVQEVYEAGAIADIVAAAADLRPVYERLQGRDGYVSLEVSPQLANDTRGTIEEGLRLWRRVGEPNLMIKVPGTKAGVPAVRALIEAGINVNVTLLFSIEAYQAVAMAYLGGLEARLARGEAIDRVASVASFFVSRIDTQIDAKIDALVRAAHPHSAALKALRGKVAIANAKLAYAWYQELVAGPRWQALAARGAMPQRLLWASTGTKDPAYPDTLYVDSLIGPDTVNTMPPKTLKAFRDHGTLAATLTADLAGARRVLAEADSLGLDLDGITAALVEDGVRQFADAADALLASVAAKRATVRAAGGAV